MSRARALIIALVSLALAACGSASATTSTTANHKHKHHHLHLHRHAGAAGAHKHKPGTPGKNKIPPANSLSASGFSTLVKRPVGRSTVPVTLPAPAQTVTPSSPAGKGGSALASAIERAAPGTVIQLASGSYPKLKTSHTSTAWVTISGVGDATPPVIDGAKLQGASYLRFVAVKFTHRVGISASTVHKAPTPSTNIQVLDSEIDCGVSTVVLRTGGGILVRGAAQNIRFAGDYVHNCTVGFGSVAQDPVSSGISITYSTFQNLTGDAMDLGGLDHLVIDHDIIRNIADPQGNYHNDGIQFFGNCSHVQITNNVLANSHDQLLFIQDAVKSTVTGSSLNSDILVAHNVIYGAGAIAVQAQGALDTRFIQNTMWSNHFGSLLIRKSSYTKNAPDDTVLVGNIIEGFAQSNVTPRVELGNVIVPTPGSPNAAKKLKRLPGNVRTNNPGFVGAGAGNFSLARHSPGRGRVTVALVLRYLAGSRAAGRDMFGKRYPRSGRIPAGAIQATDPAFSFGAPIFGPAPLE